MIFCTSAFSQNIIPNGFAFQSIARDINGNIKNPIGFGIDDIKTKEFYENDEKYDLKL